MSTSSLRSLDEKILKVLDDSWRTVGEIHRLVGAGEALEVARALNRLWEVHRIEKDVVTTIVRSGRRGGGGELRFVKFRRRQHTENASTPVAS
ncbi:hypothetical protein ACFKHW_40120 (plasmid) [Bradyrhizobium lupini]|uniref:hypothetical protein n=1 Tax=Rhizobium lupini TaxID=136996 RepID=UPI00366FD5E9